MFTLALRTTSNMAFKSPPELLLRQVIRKSVPRPVLQSTSSRSSYVAAVCTELGAPLQIQQQPICEQLSDGEVRLAVHSAAINFADILMAQGKYQEKPPLPYTGGSELSGQVVEVGPGVSSVAVGDRVFCVGGSTGAFAQEAVCAEMSLGKIPANVSYDVGASFLCSYGTAYMALTRKANIKPGETVLVTAAAGAVGMAAVDLAANVFNCKVIGAVGDASKCDKVKAKGASDCIVYSKESLRERVKEITDGKGADIIFDAVGGKVFEECVRCIAFEGRLLVIGFASGDIPKLPANLLLVKSCSAMGVYWGSYSYRHREAFMDSVNSTAQYLAQGKIKPAVSATFPLNKINEAFKHITDRQNVGKVIINPLE